MDFLNSLYHPSLSFSVELESNNRMPFLDVLILKSSNDLLFKVFRKSTHSNSYLHFFSFHEFKIKMTVARGLFLRAFRICSSPFLNAEILFIFNSLSKLGYPSQVLHKALLLARSSFLNLKPLSRFLIRYFFLFRMPFLLLVIGNFLNPLIQVLFLIILILFALILSVTLPMIMF